MTNDPTELLTKLSTLIDSQQEALANLERQRVADLGAQAELFRAAQQSSTPGSEPSAASSAVTDPQISETESFSKAITERRDILNQLSLDVSSLTVLASAQFATFIRATGASTST